MNLFKTILRVRPQSFWALLKLCMPNILLLWPTYKATKDCMKLSTEHFGRKHYQNGRGNAFRHALWNVLIAKYCHPVAASLERAVEWTKKITDWHEEAFFGKTLPMLMDYHNNKVGRSLFQGNSDWPQETFIEQLLQLTQEAVKVNQDSLLNQYQNQLIFISDDH